MRNSLNPILCLSPILALALTGCGSHTGNPSVDLGISLHGNVHGGQQPVGGAHVYLFAAATTGYGQPSISLLNAASTHNADALGAYVLTNAAGDFSISGDYTCTASTQVYVLAIGGDPGAGINTAAAVMAVLGNCPSAGNFASTVPYLAMNEISTVAAAYALSGFATDATHVSSSGTPLALTGIANAFANAANLASIGEGYALTRTPAGNGAVPQKLINTVANILASCINTGSSTSAECSALFANTLSAGASGTPPTETATAAINIAHNPGANVANLFNLPTPAAPFSPTLVSVPMDFTLAVTFSGGGLSGPSALAVDALGNIWAASLGNAAVTQLAPSGAPISPAAGYPGHATAPISIAIDLNGDAWIADAITSSVAKYSSTGSLLSPAPVGYTGGGLAVPQGIAIDAGGNAWVASFHNAVSEFTSTGLALSPALGFTGGGLNGPGGIAIDSSGAVWVPNCSTNGISGVTKFSSAGAPLSPVNGFLGGGVKLPYAIAIDGAGSAWVANIAGNSLTELSATGAPISSSTGYTGGGLNLPFALAIDGSGNAWVANYGNNTISEFATDGTPISPSTGFAHGSLVSPQALAIDGSGNIWIANANDITLTEVIGAAAPVVTPMAAAIKSNALGARP